ncbi:solute carrier family 25 member 38 [Mycena galericulata]|nr:solute carrier family 25 member 38 [Mycena galericulata]
MDNVGQQLFSGALSGFASTVCLQPFDLLKTRLQQGDGTVTTRNTTTLLRTTQQIVASHGLIGLWRGTNATLAREVRILNVPGVALYMTSLTQLRTVMATSAYFAPVRSSDNRNASVLPKLTSQGNLLAGATTRVAVGFLLNPFSVLKARYESNMYAYKSLTGAFLSIARLGPSELFRGFLASSLRDAPYAGIFVVLYEGIKRQSASILRPTSDAQSTLMHTISAASAGAIATMATHPFDVIKTKVQVRSEDRYHGFQRTVRTIWTQRGPAGFFDGASLRMSRKILSSAIGWAVYEGVLMFIRTSHLDT